MRSEYRYSSPAQTDAHAYLLPALLRLVGEPTRVFDIGCGNGAAAGMLAAAGHLVSGVDPSTSGIAQARREHPTLDLRVGSAYDDLAALFGRFPVVISVEVVEHVYAPRDFARTLFDLVEPGGMAIISTPFHGYFKNLVLALSGKMDAHFGPLWDHGHIKFWSERTLTSLLAGAGFQSIRFERVGRVPALARSMIATALKPDCAVIVEEPIPAIGSLTP